MEIKGFFNTNKKTANSIVPSGNNLSCAQCGLFQHCHSPRMKPTGEGKKKIFFLAEAPGFQEDRRGEQLVGDS